MHDSITQSKRLLNGRCHRCKEEDGRRADEVEANEAEFLVVEAVAFGRCQLRPFFAEEGQTGQGRVDAPLDVSTDENHAADGNVLDEDGLRPEAIYL